MKLGLVLVAAALLAWCAVDVDGRPQPGTTGGKHNEDLDGIGDDLEDFLKHRDENNNHRLSDSQSVLQTNRNTNWLQQNKKSGRGAAGAAQPPALGAAVLSALKKPSSSGSGSDLLSDLLKFGQGGGGLGSLGSLGGLTRPSNPSTSVQYPSRPASPPASAPASPQYPSRPSAPASPSRPASVPSYPSRPASVPSYPSYPTGAGQGSLYPQVPQVPAGGGWVAPSGGSTAPKKQGGGASYPSYPVSNYPSYPASNYPSYPSYTNYQRGSPNPYPGYQQPTYQQPAYQQPAAYPGYQQTYPGYQTVQRYDPRNPPPPQKKEGTSVTKSVSNFFKKIFS